MTYGGVTYYCDLCPGGTACELTGLLGNSSGTIKCFVHARTSLTKVFLKRRREEYVDDDISVVGGKRGSARRKMRETDGKE